MPEEGIRKEPNTKVRNNNTAIIAPANASIHFPPFSFILLLMNPLKYSVPSYLSIEPSKVLV